MYGTPLNPNGLKVAAGNVALRRWKVWPPERLSVEAERKWLARSRASGEGPPSPA